MPYHGRYFPPLIDGVAFKTRAENSPQATRSRRARESRTGGLDMDQLRVLRTESSRRFSGNSFHLRRRRVMRSLVLALLASLAFIAATSSRAVADTSDTQVTLTCNDGHSVTFALDPTALLALTAEVQALSDPSGLSCTLDPADPPPASWTVYDYNPSGQALRPRVSANSMPATTAGDGSISFPFKLNTYTALLTTTDKSLTGDLSSKTLTAMVEVLDGDGTFQHRNTPCDPGESFVRFFFVSPKASGTTGPGTTGFYTQFWWSNPAHVPLVTDPQPKASMGAVVTEPTEWSDWNGKRGDDSPAVLEHFMVAIHNVQTVGFSFGGGCFFENGVTTSDGGGTFHTTFTETP